MKLVHINPNPSGAYPPIQEGNYRSVPAGMAIWPKELSTDTFYAHNGFVTLTVEIVDDLPVVTGCEANTETWEDWKASLMEEAEPSVEEQIADLKAKLTATDYQAIKYAEGWMTDEEYAPIKAQRQVWRDEINELES